MLTAKKNLRLLEVAAPAAGGVETRPISGGLLMQARDAIDASGEDKDGNATGDDPSRWRLVAGAAASTRRRWPTWSSPGGRSGR